MSPYDPLIVVNGRVLWYDRHAGVRLQQDTDLLDITWSDDVVYRAAPGLRTITLFYRDRAGHAQTVLNGVWHLDRRPSGRPYWQVSGAWSGPDARVLAAWRATTPRNGALDDRTAARILPALLAEHGAAVCAACQHPIGLGDIAWNNRSTEAGTGYTVIEIQCAVCDTEVVRIVSWYPAIDGYGELLYVIDRDWNERY